MNTRSESYSNDVRISIVGVGGAGGNLLTYLHQNLHVDRITELAINTDVLALKHVPTDSLVIGETITKGLGSGADPQVGRQAAESSRAEIAAALAGTDLVFIVAGMGGGTGSGAAPVVAEIAKASGALCVAMVTTPFDMEGSKRRLVAERSLSELLRYADCVYVEPNQLLVESPGSTLLDGFKEANEGLENIIRDIVSLVRAPGMINLDVSDLRFMFANAGLISIGTGRAAGRSLAIEAARSAVRRLGDNMSSADRVLVIVRSTLDFSGTEFDDIGSYVKSVVPDGADILLGTVNAPDLRDKVIVTIIVNGSDDAVQDLEETEDSLSAGLDASPAPAAASEARDSGSRVIKPVHLLALDSLSDRDIADFVEHLSALYRSVGGDELVVTDIHHVTPDSGAISMPKPKQSRRTG